MAWDGVIRYMTDERKQEVETSLLARFAELKKADKSLNDRLHEWKALLLQAVSQLENTRRNDVFDFRKLPHPDALHAAYEEHRGVLRELADVAARLKGYGIEF
jgi:hypothetical protein